MEHTHEWIFYYFYGVTGQKVCFLSGKNYFFKLWAIELFIVKRKKIVWGESLFMQNNNS